MAVAKENKVVHGADLAAIGAGIRKAYPRIYVGSCDTAAATAAKVVTVETFPLDGSGKPLVGTVIAVKFSVTNTGANATLAVMPSRRERGLRARGRWAMLFHRRNAPST